MHPPQDDLGIRVHLLGRFEVWAGDQLIIDQSWPRRKAKALFKILVLNRGQWLHRERLMETLWPDHEPASADHNFRQNLHHLRKAFADHGLTLPIVSVSSGMFNLSDDVVVDVEMFRDRAGVAQNSRTDPELYEAALAMYAGDLLPEDIFEEWTEPCRDQLKALERRLVLDLAQLLHLLGRSESAIRRLDELLQREPLDEEVHRSLMSVHAESGNRLGALRQYEKCSEILSEELGVEPSGETARLQQEILDGSGRLVHSPIAVSGTFIGRENEMRELVEGLEEAIRARGSLFMLAGEAGIGKTRTAEELATHARLRGAQVLWGHCYDGEGAPAYWPWVQALRAYTRENPSDELKLVVRDAATNVSTLLPEVRTTLPDLPAPDLGQSKEAQFRLFDAVGTFLANAAARCPTVLILDDLHRADRPSLKLLEFMSAAVSDSHLLVLGTYRDTELPADHPLTRSLAVLERHHLGHTISFKGLSEDDVAGLMRASTGEVPTARLAAAVHEQTGGNPFLVQELSNAMVAAGLPDQALDSPGWGIVLPRGAQAVILQSLDRLSGPCQRVLAAAAVAGSQFELSLLERLESLSDAPLGEAMEEALTAQIVVRVEGATNRLAFRHALIREALYAHLPTDQRMELHRQIGEALEQAYGATADDHISELAHHTLEAVPVGPAGTAVQYARRAADRAMGLFAYDEAAVLYEKALALEDAMDDTLRCELLLSLGAAKWDAGDPAQGRQAFEAAAKCARQRHDDVQLAQAALGCGRSLTSIGTVDQPLVDLLEEALSGLSAEHNSLRAMLTASLARALYWSTGVERRSSLSREAVELARREGDQLVQAHVLDAAWIALWRPDNPGERLELATEMIRLADAVGDKARAHQGHRWRMIALLELGDTAGAREEFAAQARIARELRQSAQLENVSVVSAMWALFEGQFDEAERLVKEALASAERSHDQAAPEQFGAQMIVLLRERNHLPQIESMVREFVEQDATLPGWRSALAWIHSQQGKESEARAEFERLAADDFACLHQDYMWLLAMMLLADVCYDLQDRKRAATLYEQLLPFANNNIVMGYAIVGAGSASRSLGQLAATLRLWKDAERHFERAVEMNERMGARPWLAWTQYNFARMLTDRGNPGDRLRARSHLECATTSAKGLGMTALEEACRSVRASLRSAPA